MKRFADLMMKFLIVLSIALGLIAFIKPELIKAAIEWMREVIQLLGYWNYVIVILSSTIESFPVLGVVVPGQNILIIVGGFFAELSKENLIYVTIIASIGAILGNYIGYYLGKIHGEEFFKRYGLWFGIGETEVRYIKKGIKKWGIWGIILGKFHPAIRAFMPFIAGSMGMKSKHFMYSSIIASILRAFAMIILGILFAKTYEIIIDYLEYIFFGIMILGGLYIWRFKKQAFLTYMEEKNREIEAKMR